MWGASGRGAAPEVVVTEDKTAFILGFADGSFGTIHYLANGAASFPKERIEVFCAGRVLQLGLNPLRRLRARIPVGRFFTPPPLAGGGWDTIDQGFLSTLGPRFLRLLYQAIDECPEACLLLAREGDQVVGFVAGALNMGPVYRRLRRHWPALGLSLALSLPIPRRLWRILEILVIEVHRGVASTVYVQRVGDL